jgi:cyclopropane fatty-acyl-phospholipid synthase-like methyltransferase
LTINDGRALLTTVKDLIRPIPGVRSISLLRQRIAFVGSGQYWESRYADGGTSGCGSYGESAQDKANFLNMFVHDHNVQSVTEFGCGDGHQLSLARYPRYIGLDVSQSAIKLCKSRFLDDPTKSFFLYEGDCFVDSAGLFTCDLALSLDVVYHLTEDCVFETYMDHLFAAGRRYVVVYSTNDEHRGTAPHVRHRNFSSWVSERFPRWSLAQVVGGSGSGTNQPDFFVYEQR